MINLNTGRRYELVEGWNVRGYQDWIVGLIADLSRRMSSAERPSLGTFKYS